MKWIFFANLCFSALVRFAQNFCFSFRLGKPKGTIQKSKFAQDAVKIKELLTLGLSVREIAIFLGYTNHIDLNTYVKK